MSDHCYEACNERYTSMQPERLFCKKGCDSDDDPVTCKNEGCNNLCIKEEQGEQKLMFNFLYRAPKDHRPCLNACIYGCAKKQKLND